MKNKYTIALLILIVFYSCHKTNNTIYYKEFPKTISLTGAPIKIKENIFPFGIGVHKDKIVFCDTQISPHFYVYSLPNFELIGKFGIQGKSPVEIEDPVFWGQIKEKGDSVFISFYQMNKMKFTTFELNKVIKAPIKENDLEVTYMPPEIADAVNIMELNSKYFVGSGSTLLGEFFLYKADTDKLRWFDFIIDYNNNFMNKLKSNNLLQEYKRGIIKVKPDNSKFAKVYNYTSKINIFGIDGKLLFSIQHSNDKQPTIKSTGFENDTKIYYNNVFLTNTYIYALNLNCNLGDYLKGNFNSVEIDVFNWKGTPIKKIQLNESIGPLSPFVVDEINDKIYTVNPKTEDSYFSSFNY